MSSVIIDCDLMKFPNSGLFHYCKNLGESVAASASDEVPLRLYIPSSVKTVFKEIKTRTIIEQTWHRMWKPFLFNCRVWHAPFQSGRMIPNKKLFRHINTVLTIHDLNVLHEGKPLAEQRKSISHVQNMIDKSDVVVCISEFTKGEVEQHCDPGNKKLTVIPNGINPLAEPRASILTYKPKGPFLFGIGYVNSKKNFHTLVDLLAGMDGWEVVVSGRLDEPDYINKIQEKVEQLGLTGRFHLTGPVTEEEKSWYIHNCTAFVHPSLAEGFGLPVLEAMSAGKPVFLSNRTSLPEVSGEAAFYFRNFSPGHMRDIIHSGLSEFEARGMAPLVKERAHTFSWEKTAEAYSGIYRSLM